MDDGYDHFMRQEVHFLSQLLGVCKNNNDNEAESSKRRNDVPTVPPPGIYYSMRWSNMDANERDLYKLLSKSNSKSRNNDNLNFHHSLKELLSDKDNINIDEPINIPQKRLNINHELLELLERFDVNNNNNNNKSSKNKKKKKKNHYNMNINMNINNKNDIDTIRETDINQLLRIREDNTIVNDVNDNDDINKYSTDETDISQLLLGLKK